ncbi:hypothetical protein SCA6_001072 [Theobroma cacao]
MEDFSDMLLLTLGRRNMTVEDRISKLPDDLLLKIMSLLNTKQAVQTCVLSKRWKPLWQSLPNLDFNFDTFPFQQETDDEDKEEVEMKMCSFSNFISQVLFRRCPTDLVKVCVQSHIYDPHCFLVDGLLCYAVKHNVQQLTFHSRSDCQYLFPESFWTCQSLTSLELKGSDWMPMKLPTLLACPALKSLHLSHFSAAGPNFEPTAFSGCPNLETLQLFDILAVGSEGLCIDALKLTSLVLSFASLRHGKVEIYAPRLTTFKYSGIPPIVCLTDHLASVDDVYFDIKTLGFKRNEEEYVLRLINTLNEFRHAKSLTLSSSTVQVLTKFPSLLYQNRLPFANLKHLKIKAKKWESKRFEMPACILNYFLNNSTILKICMDSKASYESNDWMAVKLPTLLACPALKSLHLSHFSMAGPNFEPTAFSGCPNLQTLQLFDIWIGSENLCINAVNLRSLLLSFVLHGEGKVEICAPRLTTFKYSGIPPIVSSKENLAFLDDVSFDIKAYSLKRNEEESVIRLINTFKEFRQAKSLTLSTSTVKILAKFPSLLDQNRLPFANLKHLKIKVKKWQSKRFEMPACILNCFLNNSTILKIYSTA